MPKRFNRLQGSDIKTLLPQIDRNFAMLDKEVSSKRFTDRATGTTLTIGDLGNGKLGMNATDSSSTQRFVFGKYGDNLYGFLLYDEDGIPVALMGQSPDDGRPGVWVAKPGENVLTLLGG